MKFDVRYYTRSGNSKKLADAVACAIGVKAEDVSCPLTEKTENLFLVTDLYAGDVDASVKAFIEANSDKIGAICSVSSAASKKTARKAVSKVADKYGIKVLDEEFFCNGSFLFMHKGRPNAKDLEDAAEFAKKIL